MFFDYKQGLRGVIGSASDSRSEGCVFESRRGQSFFNFSFIKPFQSLYFYTFNHLKKQKNLLNMFSQIAIQLNKHSFLPYYFWR